MNPICAFLKLSYGHWKVVWTGSIFAVLLAIVGFLMLILSVVNLAPSLSIGDVPIWYIGILVLLAAICVLALTWLIAVFMAGIEVTKQNQDLLAICLDFFEAEMRYGEQGGDKYHYSTAIRNVSERQTINGCMVCWLSSQPRVPHVSSADLHRSGASRDVGIPSRCNVAPGRHERFDFLRINAITGQWDIPVDWDPNGIPIPTPTKQIEVQLMLSGEQATSKTQRLVIKPLINKVNIAVQPGDPPGVVNSIRSAAIFIKSDDGQLRRLDHNESEVPA
jgi:hypothetical protein